jgi:phosphohistidine phosphatase
MMEVGPIDGDSLEVFRSLTIGGADGASPERGPTAARTAALDLVLWRHAEAEPACPEGDLWRELTRKGQRQAARMAAWLDQRLPGGTRVLCSPARRALQTSQALGRNVKARDELGPLAAVDDALALLKWGEPGGPRLKGSVLVVSHRALLGPLASHLLGIAQDGVVLRKGAVCWLRIRSDAGAVRTGVVALLSPDLLSGA